MERADRSEGMVDSMREQVEQVTAERDRVPGALADLAATVATVRAERDVAVADVSGEIAHGSQRVDDIRITYTEQIEFLRTEHADARASQPAAARFRRDGNKSATG